MDATKATSDALYQTGCWLRAQGRNQDALHVFRTMLLVAPEEERGWLALGLTHEDLGERQKAAALYELATRASKMAMRCRIALARILRDDGLEDRANELFAEAAQLADEVSEGEVHAILAQEGWSP